MKRKLIKNLQKPELLVPAGNWSALKTALECGADSVYFGIKDMNMRHMADNFHLNELGKIMQLLRENKKKGYLALNTVILQEDLKKVEKILKAAHRAKVDAVILWDMAVFQIAKKLGLDIHVSTQASVANIEAIKAYSRMGAKRIILARECQLKNIKEIAQRIKRAKLKIEVETFIHGAMCLTVSGRCFLSQFSFGQSANKGKCLQPCRREYRIFDLDEESEYVVGQDYVLSPKDLCSIDFIDKLIESGIHSFKIEGRMRAPEYVKVVTESYRRAIDAFFAGKLTVSLKRTLKKNLAAVYNRGFSSGFYFGEPHGGMSQGLEHTRSKVFVGEVTRVFKRINVAEVRLRSGALKAGDRVLFAGKKSPAKEMIVGDMHIEHQSVKEVQKGDVFGLKVPFLVRPKDKVFLWQDVE